VSRAAVETPLLSVSTDFNEYSSLFNSFKKFATFKGSVTPTKFMLYSIIYVYTSTGAEYELGRGIFDLVQGITVTFGEVPQGVTISAMKFEFWDGFYTEDVYGNIIDYGTSRVELDWPFYTGTNDAAGKEAHFNASGYGYNSAYNPILSIENGIATIPFGYFEPAGTYQDVIVGPGEGLFLPVLHQIIYGAGERRLYYGEPVPVSEVIPGVETVRDPGGSRSYLGFYDPNYPDLRDASVVIPFEPITIPYDASSVTFEISWNLQNIIEAYTTSGVNDKGKGIWEAILVLKNGWWDGLYMTAKID
jgi:hypothetical protein